MRHPFLRTLAGSAAPAATDPNFENVTLLLHGDGTNGGQNNTFVDGSTNNFTITRNGNTTQGTFSPYGDLWSNYFDGTGDYLTRAFTSTTDGMYLQGTTYTVEAWVFPLTSTGTRVVYDCSATVATNFGQTSLYLDGTSVGYSFRPTTGGASTNIVGGTLSINNWNHVAVSVNAGSARVFLNGTQVGSTTTISAASFTPVGAGIGRFGNNFTTGVADYTGYISNVRVVQSTALYTANFTPATAPLTAITNTSLLTCQSNRFRDASTNNFTLTRNGDVSVQRFSPFSPTAAYAAGTIGGSGYFDGSGDYLKLTGSALGTSQFCVELWYYPTASLTNAGLYDGRTTNGSSTGIIIRHGNNAGSATTIDLLVGATTISKSGLVINSWNHIAVCRNSSNTTNVFVNGSAGTSATISTNLTDTGVTIGAFVAAFASPYAAAGYVSNLRVVVGSSVYDPTQATLTVPTAPLTAITNTSLLLNFTNAAILDNAMMAVPETVGNAQISTSVKKYGTGSLYFDGTGDYIHCKYPAADVSAFGAGDFTVEFWLYTNAANTTYNVIDWRPTSTNGAYLAFYLDAGTPQVYFSSANKITGGAKIAGTTWTHVAICRSGSSMRLFIDGTQSGSTLTDTTSFLGSVDRPAVGGFGGFTNNPLNGYIDDLRVTKGFARYTANFTAPTAAFPDL